MEMEENRKKLSEFYGRDPLKGDKALKYFFEKYGKNSINQILSIPLQMIDLSNQVYKRFSKLTSLIGKDSTEELYKMILEGDWKQKKLTSVGFDKLGSDPKISEDLINILRTNNDTDIQRITIQSLGYLGSINDANTLVDLIQEGELRYNFDKLYSYILMSLIRMIKKSKEHEDVRRCLFHINRLLDICDKNSIQYNSLYLDIVREIQYFPKKSNDVIWNKWINSNREMFVSLGFEVIKSLCLKRNADRLINYMLRTNIDNNHKSEAGLALGDLVDSETAKILISKINDNNFPKGFDWAVSTLWIFSQNWPNKKKISDRIFETTEISEVGLQLLYSMSITGDSSKENILNYLNSDKQFTRGIAALCLSRLLGEEALPILKDREEEAKDHHEEAFLLVSQINSGHYEKINKLNEVLQKNSEFVLLRKIWKREILNAFFIVEGEDSERGKLWCEILQMKPSSIFTEMKEVLNQKKIVEEDESYSDKHVVILVHGIRTQAEWQQRVAKTLKDNGNIISIPARYEFLDIIRFIIPFDFSRAKPINRITRIIRDAKKQYKIDKVSIIAHSFGTYIVARILMDCTDIEFKRVILCGSIIKDDFGWDHYINRFDENKKYNWQIVNDCGMNDIWPVLAKSITYGYGSSGRFGFGHNRVKDRFHNKGHGDFFNEDFVKSQWIPFLEKGEVKDGEIERTTNSWWISILTVIELKYVIMVLLVIYFLNDYFPIFN